VFSFITKSCENEDPANELPWIPGEQALVAGDSTCRPIMLESKKGDHYEKIFTIRSYIQR
jgi:hypothetical protein